MVNNDVKDVVKDLRDHIISGKGGEKDTASKRMAQLHLPQKTVTIV
jgi:hypothetical protein